MKVHDCTTILAPVKEKNIKMNIKATHPIIKNSPIQIFTKANKSYVYIQPWWMPIGAICKSSTIFKFILSFSHSLTFPLFPSRSHCLFFHRQMCTLYLILHIHNAIMYIPFGGPFEVNSGFYLSNFKTKRITIFL